MFLFISECLYFTFIFESSSSEQKILGWQFLFNTLTTLPHYLLSSSFFLIRSQPLTLHEFPCPWFQEFMYLYFLLWGGWMRTWFHLSYWMFMELSGYVINAFDWIWKALSHFFPCFFCLFLSPLILVLPWLSRIRVLYTLIRFSLLLGSFFLVRVHSFFSVFQIA